MKEYGLYDIKDNETCVYIGTYKEVAKFLNCSENSLMSWICNRRKNKRNGLIKKKYELVEIKESEEQEDTKTNEEIFRELVNLFTNKKQLTLQKIIDKFPKYYEVNMNVTEMCKEIFMKNYLKEQYKEEWKKIRNLDYEISNYGRIRNINTKKLKKLKYQVYGMQVILWKNSKSYTITISRLVAEMFIRHVNNDEKVVHINKDIRDNYYKNLEIVKKGR